MRERTIISAKAPTEADWRWLDEQSINVGDLEQLALLADLFHTSIGRIFVSVDAVGPRLGDVRRYLQYDPAKPGRPFRRRSR